MYRELVTRAKTGDLEAFDALVARFQDAVSGSALAILGSFEDAQDVAQEALIQAWRDLSSLRDPSSFPAWLCRITQNRCRDFLRRARRDEPAAPVVTAPGRDGDPVDQVARTELREKVLAAIRSLSEPNRLATTLFYINGYSINEVAEFLDVPAGTVKRRLHDSRKRLQGSMDEMIRETLDREKPGPELRAEVAAELRARHERFNESARRCADWDATDWAREYHERRMEDVRANAAQYGIEPDEDLPRMLPEYWQQETFRDDTKDMPRRWGIPEGLELVTLHNLSRELEVSPLSVHRWEQEGLPCIRYDPWVLYDRARVEQWLAAGHSDPVQRITGEKARTPLLLVLEAVRDGLASAEEAGGLYRKLETALFFGPPDPLWADEWRARRRDLLAANARQYGLSGPTDGWLGIPGEELAHVFEIRDITRRLEASPIDFVRWTRDGMPCLRTGGCVRWDIRRVTAWLAERGIVPTRHTAKELDWTEHFVCDKIAAGEATPDEAHEALSGRHGVM